MRLFCSPQCLFRAFQNRRLGGGVIISEPLLNKDNEHTRVLTIGELFTILRRRDEMRIFGALYKGEGAQFGPRTMEKCFEKDSVPLWRAKKSHFRPSEKSGMKNVDKMRR